MKSTIVLGIGATLLASCSGNKQKTEEKVTQRQKPNVIFLIADDIGYGDLSCNGSKTIHTPNVEKLAAQGVRFTDAHAVAATSTPSRYSLFTGHYAWRRNDTGIAAGNAGMVIRPEQPTVADMFRECGYTTGAIGKWHLGLSDRTGGQDWNGFITPGPSDIGFDYSYIMAATGDRVPCVWVENQRIVNLDPNDPIEVSYEKPFPGEPLGKDHPELLTKLKPSPNHGHDMAIVNGISRIGYMKGGKQALWEDENIADSIRFIENHKDEPFFLYVGTNDAHVPRWPHPRFVGKSGMGPRGDALLQFDWTVGEIMDALEKAGCNRIFIDVASGAKAHRPELDHMLDLLREGDTVVVWKLDRLGRSMQNLVELINDFDTRGVQFRSLTELIDTSTPGGTLIFNIFGSLAQFERDLIRERTRAGLEAARARGRTGGRPASLDEKQAKEVQRLYESRSVTVDQIASMMRVSRTTIYRCLQKNKETN